MIMEALKDIVMKAFPDRDTCVVDSKTMKGLDFMMKQWSTVNALLIKGDEVNDFIAGIKEAGVSYSFKLGV